MIRKEKINTTLLETIVSPLLAIVTFLISNYYMKSGNLTDTEKTLLPLSFAMLISYLSHTIVSFIEKKRYSDSINQLFETVKKYNHVITIGSPTTAISYVTQRLDILDSVWNTSINSEKEEALSTDALYDSGNSEYSKTYDQLLMKIKYKSIKWRDIYNSKAKNRIEKLMMLDKDNYANNTSVLKKYGYERRIIKSEQIQMNYMILRYKDKNKKTEVLFNWEHDANEFEPQILLSEDSEIVKMFTANFIELWHAAEPALST
ncbi:MAG: hypothetical protein MUC87_08950 [Bacteroidia bacterium]|jgi:hypothetical protein|nr:hypothetical protein [Bacteroidia bacterium]